MQTEESYFRSVPGLVRDEQIAGSPLSQPRFDRLQALSRQQPNPHHTTITQSDIDKRRQKAAATGDPIDHLHGIQLLLSAAHDEDLISVAETVFSELCAVKVAETGESAFVDPTLHVLHRRPALYARAKLLPALLRLEYDTQLATGDVSGISAHNDSGDFVFASSEDLSKGLIMLDPYIGPLLACLSPGVWGFAVFRSFGPVVFSMGQPLTGTQGDPAELLQMLSSESNSEVVDFKPVAPGACSAALAWWTAHLDKLFGTVTDPAVFTSKDGDGAYLPSKHLAKILNVEQVFRRVHAIQTSYRDHNARKSLLFTVLDTVESLLTPKLEDLCRLKTAEKALDELKDGIPTDAATVLLPAAERAVAALRELQNGFFIPRQLGKTTVSIPYTTRPPVEQDLETATAQYLTVLRNSTHGHGGVNIDQEERSNALLAQHNGEIPYHLPDLGYLYLLTLLNRPEEVRMNFFYNSHF